MDVIAFYNLTVKVPFSVRNINKKLNLARLIVSGDAAFAAPPSTILIL